MADFLEEVLYSTVKYGSSWQDEYNVNVVETSGGSEYRSLIHPFPKRTFTLDFELATADMWGNILDLYHRAHGTYAGFRAHCHDEDSSNGSLGTPTAFDQPTSLVSPGVYQLRKYYGLAGTAGASGYPYRTIKKPVAGTVKAAIGALELASSGNWSIDTATGLISFLQNNQGVSGISNATSAVVTLPINHQLSAGMSVYFSGVSGMTQINGLRGMVIGQSVYSITVDIDTSGFSTWTSGGVISKAPQAGESVTAGFRFHFPVRFKTVLPIGQDYPLHRVVDGVEFVEIFNP